MQNFDALCMDEEGRLLEVAEDELPEAALLDRAGNELFRVAQQAKAFGPPAGAPAGWGASSNGVLAGAAMALRTGRAIGLLVRSGYSVEAVGLVRRLGEITQHAASCAGDPAGTYAGNWGAGAGKAGKPSSAYMQGVTDPGAVRDKWGFLSQMEHANLRPYLNFMCSHDEHGEIVHPVAPARHQAADALVLSSASAAWDLARVAAAVCKAHSDLDDAPTLQLAQELRSRQAASDARIDAWVLARRQQMGPDADAPNDGGRDPTGSASRGQPRPEARIPAQRSTAPSSNPSAATRPLPRASKEATDGEDVPSARTALTALAGPPISIKAAVDGVVPDQPGLYALYGAPDVWRLLGLGKPPDERPLYVGKAEDSLVSRDLKTHFASGTTGRSSPRRSLAALLAASGELALVAMPRRAHDPEPAKWTHYGLEDPDDRQLTDWMGACLRIAVWPAPAGTVLRPVESAAISHWLPPLNLTGVTTPWTAQVKAARVEMAERAKDWARSRGFDV